jgi:hypothetical protein
MTMDAVLPRSSPPTRLSGCRFRRGRNDPSRHAVELRMATIVQLSVWALLVLSLVAATLATQPFIFPTAAGVRATATQLPPFKIEWFAQTLDHFNFATEPQTFNQRYIVCGTRLLFSECQPIRSGICCCRDDHC